MATPVSPSTSLCWRALPELPGGAPGGGRGQDTGLGQAPPRQSASISAHVVRVHAVQLVPGSHGRTLGVHRRLEHRPGSRVVRALQVHVLQGLHGREARARPELAVRCFGLPPAGDDYFVLHGIAFVL
jgi:hypothetical protein